MEFPPRVRSWRRGRFGQYERRPSARFKFGRLNLPPTSRTAAAKAGIGEQAEGGLQRFVPRDSCRVSSAKRATVHKPEYRFELDTGNGVTSPQLRAKAIHRRRRAHVAKRAGAGRSRRSRQPLSGSGIHWSARTGWPVSKESTRKAGTKWAARQRTFARKTGLGEVTREDGGGHKIGGRDDERVSP